MTGQKHIAFFGGSFNPPHVGHQGTVSTVLGMPGVDEVWVVPCFQHVFGKELVSFEHRMAMCHAIMDPFGNRVKISDVERQIGGPSYTLHTLRHLIATTGNRFSMVVGTDILAEKHLWEEWDEICKIVTLLEVPRTSTSPSSTAIRKMMAAGERVDHFVPEPVLQYIVQHRVYPLVLDKQATQR